MAALLYTLLIVLLSGCCLEAALDEKSFQGMLKIERELLQNLRDYALELREKISVINGALREYNEEIEEANKDPELYVSNPLNAFRLIRHMHQDWISWQVYMEQQVGPEQVAKLERMLPQLPQQQDFQESAQTLHSLTEFYAYEPAFLVAQKENDSKLYLSPLDCYHMGLEMYQQENYHEALKWLTAAAENYTSSPYNDLYSVLGASRSQMYRMQARTYQKLNREEVYTAYQNAIILDEFNVQLLQESGTIELLSLRDPMEPILEPVTTPSPLQQQCRESVVELSAICAHNSMVSAFLLLAPLRYEELLLSPYIVVYRDAVYESEVTHIRNAFKWCPLEVKFSMDGGVSGCSIPDEYSPVMKRLQERVLDMAGSFNLAHNFHVLEYAQTEPFRLFQLFKESPRFSGLDFNEIEGTALVFLNNVEVGGAITIPHHPMFVQPRQGDALISFHDGDFEHTICPHVVGTGLVVVKFLYADTEE
ncbi:prolyl 4-hydroxylase subunit alpha-2 [Drosophila madeirensis]|uniref:Prolyl 4-hydroxylase subunit alpha-2 n=1 Tax=Drosophila madeirensis TaxID=30013 RepID=A0AAU9F9G3_DROMD